ncbi:unnamed protein product [Leptidea sinapis]|uniref:Uncharacterized protein n=1 Tax=Leptidea sinapis TaxID=189913 RepID=A0A5E4R1T6_9NEOP|nr:unnamed protein product [Leptidea sinapis]
MSDSVTTGTKTVSDTSGSESTEVPLVVDRWTNNISYRQLVLSSCIGIAQFWWHPYIHDLTKLLPFLFLHNVFSIIVAYPLFYLELALGVVTKKGVLMCWDMAPVARGIGFAMLICAAFTTLAFGVVCAWSLAFTVHSMHTFLPWLHCAAEQFRIASQTERTFWRFWQRGDRVDHLLFGILQRRVGIFRDTMLCLWGHHVKRSQSNVSGIWRDAIEFSFMQMVISQGTLVMLGSYCPKHKHKLTRTALCAFAVSRSCSTGSALILGAVHGALTVDYDNNTNLTGGTSASFILWSDFVTRIPGSQVWSLLIFFTIFVLALSSTALLVQTIMSTFTGRFVRKIRWAFLIFLCILFCFIGIITLCTQGGLYGLNFLMKWPVSKPRVVIGAIVAMVVTYFYGQSTFCEDIFFTVGEYPGIFIRVCWASSFLSDVASWTQPDSGIGWALVIITLLPVMTLMTLYLVFKFRVRNMISNEK